MSKQKSKPIPKPLAMIICDMVMDDRKTGKKILIGTFNNIDAVNFPVMHMQLSIFLSLTNGHGRYQGCLRCVNLSSGKSIVDLKGPIAFPNPLDVVEINFVLRKMIFPVPGMYAFQLFCDDELILDRKFKVSKIGKQKDDKK